MLIECTFCHATAKFPDSKEGAKVKCGECGKVYVAREKGAKKGATSATPFVIGGSVLVAILVVFFIVNSRKDAPAAPVVKATAPAEEPKIDRTGWNSELVKVVRDVYEAATQGNDYKIAGLLDAPRILERWRATPERASMPAWADMTTEDRDGVKTEVVALFTKGEGEFAIAKWLPFEGEVEIEGDEVSVVRLKVRGREESNMAETMTLDWKLAKDKDGKWKLFDWERYISIKEKNASSGLAAKGIEKVKLEDGGFIYQADPRPLPHLDDTPPEMRTKIDSAVERFLDFNARPRERTLAREELIEIGKPALPILLTKMYEFKIVDDESLAKVANVHSVLRDITGYQQAFSVTSFSPDSDQKREMAVKAWFAWYLRKGEKFEERKEGTDALEGLITPTEKEKREMERDAQRGGG
jgi:hypothetical protein